MLGPNNSVDVLGRRHPDIIFLVGCLEGQSRRYRVDNIALGVRALGYTTEILEFGNAARIWELRLRPFVIVIFRAAFEPGGPSIPLLEYCRSARIKTVFDVDDYIFEPRIIADIGGVADFSPEQLKDYEWGVRAYRTFLFCCQVATTSTEYIAKQMRDLGRDAYVVPNSLNDSQIRLADELLSVVSYRDDERIILGYFSGSNTHNRDFLECQRAIQDVMKSHSEVHLLIVGYLDLDKTWEPYLSRIERKDVLPPLEMLAEMFRCDVNLAPLELNNPFCEGKSELKFFEAGLVCVPTIASRTHSFIAAIADGDTGLLAAGHDEWREKIAFAISSSQFREDAGLRARRVALERFNTHQAATAALEAYGLRTRSCTRQAGPLRISSRGQYWD